MVKPAAHRDADCLRFVVRVTPRARRDAIENWQKDANGKPVLNVRITAAPENGRANKALLALLAQRLDVPRDAVTIARGAGARIKHVEVRGALAGLSLRLAKIGEDA